MRLTVEFSKAKWEGNRRVAIWAFVFGSPPQLPWDMPAVARGKRPLSRGSDQFARAALDRLPFGDDPVRDVPFGRWIVGAAALAVFDEEGKSVSAESSASEFTRFISRVVAHDAARLLPSSRKGPVTSDSWLDRLAAGVPHVGAAELVEKKERDRLAAIESLQALLRPRPFSPGPMNEPIRQQQRWYPEVVAASWIEARIIASTDDFVLPLDAQLKQSNGSVGGAFRARLALELMPGARA